MTKADGELKALKETFPDGDWVLELDWHKPGDATNTLEHREIKVFRDRSGTYLDTNGDPLHTFERAELVAGVPLHHIDDPRYVKPPEGT